MSREIFNKKSETVIVLAITSKDLKAGFPLTLELVDEEIVSDGGAVDGIGFGMSRSFKQADVTSGRYDIVFTPFISARGAMSRHVQLRPRDFRPAV